LVSNVHEHRNPNQPTDPHWRDVVGPCVLYIDDIDDSHHHHEQRRTDNDASGHPFKVEGIAMCRVAEVGEVPQEIELRALMVRRGFRGLSEFSRAICVSRATIRRAFTRTGAPVEYRTALAISAGLGISISELIAAGVSVRIPTFYHAECAE
jgi:DNA-binding phage protein